jgi:hypothetical protein
LPTTRDELIADWQKRLAAANELPEESTSRAAWLVRLRMRLYRFLLSLYGEGRWNAPEEIVESAPDSHGSVVIDTQALPLAPRPTKDENSIRAVLNSVASAREHRAELGPLAAGIDRDGWVVVASVSRGFDPQLVAAALQAKGIVPRLVGRRRDVTVEVRAYHEAAALELIDSQHRRLALRPRPAHSSPVSGERERARAATLHWSIVFLSLAVGPLIGVVGAVSLALSYPDSFAMPTPANLLDTLILVWAGSFSLVGLVYLFAGLRRKSQGSPLDRSE